MDMARVGDVMDRNATPISALTTVNELMAWIARREPGVTRHHAIPLIDDTKAIVGIVTRGNLLRTMDTQSAGVITLLEAGSSPPIIAHPDELV